MFSGSSARQFAGWGGRLVGVSKKGTFEALDTLLLVGVVVVVLFVVAGIIGTIVSTIVFALKVAVVVAIVGGAVVLVGKLR